MLSEYIRDFFVVRNNMNCLRGTNERVVPCKKTLDIMQLLFAPRYGILYQMNCVERQFLRIEFLNALRELHLQCTVFYDSL